MINSKPIVVLPYSNLITLIIKSNEAFSYDISLENGQI